MCLNTFPFLFIHSNQFDDGLGKAPVALGYAVLSMNGRGMASISKNLVSKRNENGDVYLTCTVGRGEWVSKMDFRAALLSEGLCSSQ